MRRRPPQQRNNIIYIVLIIATIAFVYYSSYFERIKPIIEIDNTIYWNLKEELEFQIQDNLNLKGYSVTLKSDQNETLLSEHTFDQHGVRESMLQISPPAIISGTLEHVQLEVVVKDKSFWNFFMGNETTKLVNVIVDKQPPVINAINQTKHIRRGGSAVVVFKTEDKNLDQVYIDTGKNRFYPSKFLKDNYYVSLIGWDVSDDNFKVVVVAKDKAKNISKKVLTLYQSNKEFNTSYLKLKDSFIDNKISTLLVELYPELDIQDRRKKFKMINENEREKNEEYIFNITSVTDSEYDPNLAYKAFKPLPNSMVVATFGDHRYYYRTSKQEVVSESYHLGIDLASVRMAPIKATSTSRVVSHVPNGIYGNMPALYHGLGLYTIYGHCSNVLVNKGDIVHEGDSIAQTGVTGLALGDHLHFGVLVQGVEVNPYDWMRQDFIDQNILAVIAKSKAIIEGKLSE